MKKNLLAECPVRRSLHVIGGKWKLLILDVFKEEVRRYGELKQAIPDISEKMLIQELKSLVENGLLTRKAYPEIPPRVEYSLTAKGKKALPIIDLLKEFGEC